MGRRHHPIHRFVLWVVSRPRTTLAITLLVAAASVALAVARLRISTDQDKLFSAKVPFFRDYLKTPRWTGLAQLPMSHPFTVRRLERLFRAGLFTEEVPPAVRRTA